MKTKEIIELLKRKIKRCYKSLLQAKNQHGYPREHIESFRCRLDELILLYQEIMDQTFVESCNELMINYDHLSETELNRKETKNEKLKS